MKKKNFKLLSLNKKSISNLNQGALKGGISIVNCTKRPSDNYSDCCLVTNGNCTGGGGNPVPAPSVEWCPTNEECVEPGDPVGPHPSTIIPIC
jgi:hypothetical protein